VAPHASVFAIDYKFFITGTLILLLDFILLVIIYQFLISKKNRLHFFLTLFLSLLSVLIFDALAFNLVLKANSENFVSSLLGHLIGKSVAAFIFAFLLYVYLKYIDKEKIQASFIANQNRDIFSILRYRKRYLDLKEEKKQVEQKLTSKLETSLNNISDGLVSLDTNWCYTYVNKKAGEFLGRRPESLIGKHIWTEFPEGVGLPFYNTYYKAVETQQTIYFQEYYEPFDKWFENRIYPSAEGLTIYFTDITDHKKADEQNSILLSLIETNDDFIGLASLDGKPIYLNGLGRALVGLKPEDNLPDNITKFFPENYHSTIVNEHMPNIFKSGKWHGEAQFKNLKTGDLIPIEMSGFLIKDPISKKPLALGIVASNITERKEAEALLIKSEKLFRQLTSNAPVAIFRTDKEGSCNYVNDEWIKYAGLTFDEAMGYGWSNAIHPEDKKRVLNEWKQAIITGSDFISELKFQDKNKHITWLSAKAVGLYDAQNKLYGYIGMAVDITEQKKSELALKESENHIRTILETEPECIKQLNAKGELIYMNPAGLAMIEADSLAMVVGKSVLNLISPQHQSAFKRLTANAFKGQSGKLMFELTGYKGTTRWLETHAVPLKDTDGNIISLLAVTRDITERREADILLEKNKKYLDNILNNIGDPVFVKDEQNKIILANNAFCEIFTLSREEIIGKTLAEHVPLEERESFLKIDKQVIETGIENISEETLTVNNGETRTILTKKTRFIDDNDIKYLIGIIRDITDRKKTEIELENYKNHLEELVESRTVELEKEKVKAQSADLMKSAFLATMSHELRTPMNSIIGFTGILLKEFAGPLNEEQKKQLTMVKTSGQHLLGLINDILDISKIEAGKLKVSKYPFNYVTTLKNTVEFLLPQASNKGLQITTDIAKTSIVINSDERRIEQVLLNLISNAIKFSDQGTIEIKVTISNNFITTQVIDQGIGISKADQIKLFVPFIQLKSGLSRRHEGTGLGLAISKNLIEKLGGTIKVKSKKGEGSNFTFTLPMEQDDNE
jgi:PAS domain S-box-containing protein